MAKSVNTANTARNLNWELHLNENGTWPDARVQIALLADIRAELVKLNTLLHCHNMLNIPHVLKRIDKRMQKHMPLKGKA
jgi:hypothetical protein